MEEEIAVHVILPTYQPDKRWLARQLHSILAQTGVSVRVWVCPDGPDHVAVSVAESTGDERISTLHFDQRVGVLANVQRGAEAALAASKPDDVFAFADQDDIWHPDKLAKGVAALPFDPIAASTHDARVVDADERVLAPSLNAYEKRCAHLDQLALLIANSVTGMTLVVTGEAVRRALPFPEGIPELLHDWWLALIVAGRGTIARVDEALVDYRQHERNVIGAKSACAMPLVRFPPRRIFLGPSYRLMAKEAFQSRRRLALQLAERGALSGPAAGFFLERRVTEMLRRWNGAERRYAIRCAIGMLLSPATEGRVPSDGVARGLVIDAPR